MKTGGRRSSGDMSTITSAIYNIRLLDSLSGGDSYIHRLHPLVKLLTTLVYLTAVVSFDRYESLALWPFLFYPVVLFAAAGIPAAPLLKRVAVMSPLIIGIGILNPWFDQQVVTVGGLEIFRGWLTFFSILIK